MKTIPLIAAACMATSLGAHAKAYFHTRSELIRNAEVIAIVSIGEPEATKPKGRFDEGPKGSHWTYGQQAKVHVERLLKGQIEDDFVMYGGESFICASCVLTKGKFLAFLKKDGGLWAGANWQLSLRPVRDQQVEWYVSEEQRFPMEFQNLDEVVTSIQTAIKEEKDKQVPDP
jgi:hypothetical protein